jgi:putative toxin-antitoxin system antitoxin component (TIGR02293 family)
MVEKQKFFDTKKGIQKAKRSRSISTSQEILKKTISISDMDPILGENVKRLDVPKGQIIWSSNMEKIDIIREGLPFESIEAISSKANIPIKQVLKAMDMAQTTYNKKKKDHDKLSSRDSELILLLAELLDYGLEVFNDEKEKFHSWLKRPNTSLGGVSPESLFDSLTGIQEIKNALNRIEYGNLA